MRDAVVIGAGLAGLAATLRLAEAGAKVTLVTKGIGGLQLGQGTLDILGYSPERVSEPLAELPEYVASHPGHPYAHFTPDEVASSLTWMRDLLGSDLLVGEPSRNVVLPTAVGALRPTSIYQPSMAAGIPGNHTKYLLVGFSCLKDFYPTLAAENLSLQQAPDGTPIQARAITVDFPIRGDESDTSGVNHARALDSAETRHRLVNLLKEHVRDGEVVGLPGVLGLNDLHAWEDIRAQLGHEIFEIPLQPPSVPGMRLNQAMTELVKQNARLMTGSAVISHDSENGRLLSVTVSTAGAPKVIPTKNVILAAGGFESGALEIDSYGNVSDTVLGLPLVGIEGELLNGDFWGSDQPLFRSGIAVDHSMRALNAEGTPVYTNVYAAGGNLAGATRWREKSGEGIALASALRAADSIVEGLR